MSGETELELQRALGRVEGMLESMNNKFDDMCDRLTNHSKRITVLERWRWYVIGAAAALIVILKEL